MCTVGGITRRGEFSVTLPRDGICENPWHGRRVNRFILTLTLLSLVGALGCKDDGPAFLSLGELCRRHADDVCSAREDCCDASPSTSSCQAAAEDSCVTQRRALEKETGLDYDSEQASRVLSQQRGALDECAAPFAIGRYFSGTRGEGSACARDAECESDVCDREQGVCVSNDTLLLCPGE